MAELSVSESSPRRQSFEMLGPSEQLFRAAENGDVFKARALLLGRDETVGAGMLAYRGVNGRTHLLAAARHGHLKMVLFLISEGAEVDAANDAGVTPLMVAAAAGHVEIMRSLLAAGASLALRDETGRNALNWAKQASQKRCVHELNGTRDSAPHRYQQSSARQLPPAAAATGLEIV